MSMQPDAINSYSRHSQRQRQLVAFGGLNMLLLQPKPGFTHPFAVKTEAEATLAAAQRKFNANKFKLAKHRLAGRTGQHVWAGSIYDSTWGRTLRRQRAPFPAKVWQRRAPASQLASQPVATTGNDTQSRCQTPKPVILLLIRSVVVWWFLGKGYG